MALRIERDKETGVARRHPGPAREAQRHRPGDGRRTGRRCGGSCGTTSRCGPWSSPAPATGAFCTGHRPGRGGPAARRPRTRSTIRCSRIGPKANDLWKPVVAAVEGMACGGAFYLLGEAEFVVASRDGDLLRPAHDVRHGQRVRGDLHGAADAVRGGGPDGPDGHGGTDLGAGGRTRSGWSREVTEPGRRGGGGAAVRRR